MRARLVDEGVIDQAWVDAQIAEFTALLEERVRGGAKPICPTRPTGSGAAGPASTSPADPRPTRRNVAHRRSTDELFASVGRDR